MMYITPDWRAILAQAWSIRLALLSAALSGVESALPYLAPDAPSGAFTKLAALVALLAAVARVVSQKGVVTSVEPKPTK